MTAGWALADFGLSEAGARLLMEQPRFLEAVRASAAGAVAHHGAHPQMRRYSRDRGAYLASIGALYLYFSAEGLTATRLKALCARSGVCSHGRSAALLAYMRGRGDLLSVQSQDDGRVRALVPGAGFLTYHASRVMVEVRSVRMFSTALDEALGSWSDGDVFEAYMRLSGPLMLAGFGGGQEPYTRIINVFADHDCGMLLLYDLIEDPLALRSEPFRISVSRIARRLGVSRAHVLKLLADTAPAGVLAWRPEAREVTLGDTLAEALRHSFGNLFMLVGHYLTTAAGAAAGARNAA